MFLSFSKLTTYHTNEKDAVFHASVFLALRYRAVLNGSIIDYFLNVKFETNSQPAFSALVNFALSSGSFFMFCATHNLKLFTDLCALIITARINYANYSTSCDINFHCYVINIFSPHIIKIVNEMQIYTFKLCSLVGVSNIDEISKNLG